MSEGLFQRGEFTLASGAKSSWKIECDALTDEDWQTLALMLVEVLPPFGWVEGVPRGGLPLAAALRPHVTSGPCLIADDVWTTGGSMNRYADGCAEAVMGWMGAVVFARGPLPTHPLAWPVTALFTMAERHNERGNG